jgi:glycoprotein endo-alpha-1,2-mannosidase
MHYLEQSAWKTFSSWYGVSFVPGVSPGYNDRAIRPEENNVGLSRRLDVDSEEGTLFAEHLVRARYLVDQRSDNLLLVNSWNEWHEDTQIEPVEGAGTNLPIELTNGISYYGYGDRYLTMLRRATCKGYSFNTTSCVSLS